MSNNIPLFISLVLTIIIMVGLPIFLAIFFTRRLKVSWWIVLTGVLTFAVAYALNRLALTGVNTLFSKGILSVTSDQWFPIVVAVIIGFLAAVFHESARWVGFKVLGKRAEKFGASLAAGAGHGGIESIYICVFGTAISLFTVLFYNAGAKIAAGVSAQEVQYTLSQIEMFWATPWHYGLVAAVMQLIMFSTHIFLSTMVWKSVVDRSAVWFLLAVLYHMVVVAVNTFLQQINWNIWAVQGVMAIFMLLNLYMIYRFWKEESEIEKEMEELDDDDLDEDEEEDEYDDDDDDDDGEDEEKEDKSLEINHPDENHTDGESVQE